MNKLNHIIFLIFILAGTFSISGCWKKDGLVSPPSRNNPYVGAFVCGRCHQDIYADYLTTGHSQQWQPVTDGQAPAYHWEDEIPYPIENPPLGLEWNEVSLVLGGHFGYGVFFDRDGYLITGPETYWAIQTGQWRLYDPGQPVPRDCGKCHTSGYDPDGSQDEFPGLSGSWVQGGVTCEGCHGPGRDHVKSRSADDILTDTSEGFCLGCHRGNDGHPLPGFGDVYLGNSHSGSCGMCHDPHVSFKYEFERSLYRDCVDCHTSDGAARGTPVHSSRDAVR